HRQTPHVQNPSSDELGFLLCALCFARPARDFQPRPNPGGALSLLDAKTGACISMAKLLEAGLWAMMESPIKPRSDRDVV
ncbi:hypothetical protein ABH313_13005, partial [Chromobacterium vaccinii]|uniref:hypothetical protein n=1 Tax=Chromobacterium vaccinii TaxID=1108595 RepID=UPI0032612CA0